jgi:Histidine kinase-, DNA gyrase B-, and HSP90-like ATPase
VSTGSGSSGSAGRRARVVRERIDPRLTGALFANYRTPVDAILELVDNAVDSRVRGRPLEVDLSIRPGTLVLTVVGGEGMGPRDLEREYLRWGGSHKRAGERIGRYGQGGKAAVGHLGARFAIAAGRAGDDRAYGFADNEYRDRSRLRTYELQERLKPVDAPLGYVRIEIGAVDRNLDARKLRQRLAETYRPLLEGGEIAIRVDRAPVTPAAWQLDERHEVAVRAGGRIVRGWYGLLADPPPPGTDPGVRLYHLGRLVGPPEWFGHAGPASHPGLNRLVGEVDLPHVPVTMNKSDVDRGSDEWVAVEQRLHRLLAPVVRRLGLESGTLASPQAIRTADQVRRILARALRLLESGRLFESDEGTAGMRGDGQLSLDEAVRDATPASDEPGEPALPIAGGRPDESDGDEGEPGAPDHREDAKGPPIRPSAGGARGRAIGEVVIRALDPRMRSAMVVEDGVRRVVINSRYPLYEVRKGDIWYQLETALREVCIAIPEATVPEFERRVNELMLVSLSLAERRRRTRRSPRPRTPPLFP